MNAWIWEIVLLIAIWAAHWGADQLASPLKKLRKGWGFSGVAGGALVGIATASPELAINITSAAKGVSDIGLGAMLGANLIALPLTLTVGYIAFRTGSDQQASTALPIEEETVTRHVLPYLAILALVALLTLPPAWRGLQPIDGWILLGAYLAYLAQVLLRGRSESQSQQWKKKEWLLAAAGLCVLAIGAYFTVRSTQQIVSALGISKLVGGIFITGTMSALPEVFSTWSVMRSRQHTAAVTVVLGDLVATMTIAFIPLAIVSTALQEVQLFWVSLAALAAMAAAFGALIGTKQPRLRSWKVGIIVALYLAYIAVTLIWVLNAV
ncbi:sodium:calcium antiporter [Marinimicrobium sp. ARAG 43.8]|uniref:sodium:calcium antiporter n=1 Tax=Marinimicrobium sp. ARAG 43.8 TaxID=3418719 RepID=UPI003CF02911